MEQLAVLVILIQASSCLVHSAMLLSHGTCTMVVRAATTRLSVAMQFLSLPSALRLLLILNQRVFQTRVLKVMELHGKWPIERSTYELLYLIEEVAVQMSKLHKHTIGLNLLNTALDMYTLISLSSDFEDNRLNNLIQYRSCLRRITGLLKLSSDKKIFNYKDNLKLLQICQQLSNQCVGLIKSLKNKAKSELG